MLVGAGHKYDLSLSSTQRILDIDSPLLGNLLVLPTTVQSGFFFGIEFVFYWPTALPVLPPFPDHQSSFLNLPQTFQCGARWRVRFPPFLVSLTITLLEVAG